MPGCTVCAYLSTLLVVMLARSVVAPFPEDHPYHFLNPFIEPWWNKLSESEREAIYSYWETAEPALLALAEVAEARQRAIDAMTRAAAAHGKQVVNKLVGDIGDLYTSMGGPDIDTRDAYTTTTSSDTDDSDLLLQEARAWHAVAEDAQKRLIKEKKKALIYKK